MGDVLVLCYHAVSPTWNATFSVTPDTLEHQLSQLVRAGWRGATFSDAVLAPRGRRTLAVTFDDGFASAFEVAEPILTRLGLPGTVFVPTAFMGERQHLRWQGIEAWIGTPHEDELRCMTWDEIGQLTDRGWEVGSHTCRHPHLTTLSDAELSMELRESFEQCSKHLGSPCRSIAYPYGDVDVRVATAAKETGYQTGACLAHSLVPLGAHVWPRVGIWHNDSSLRFRLKSWRFTRSARASRLRPSLGRVQQALRRRAPQT
ncbi:MAG: polysaccharide deacetylase family protein [Solirubrobacteraceae bacterium]